LRRSNFAVGKGKSTATVLSSDLNCGAGGSRGSSAGNSSLPDKRPISIAFLIASSSRACTASTEPSSLKSSSFGSSSIASLADAGAGVCGDVTPSGSDCISARRGAYSSRPANFDPCEIGVLMTHLQPSIPANSRSVNGSSSSVSPDVTSVTAALLYRYATCPNRPFPLFDFTDDKVRQVV